MALASDDADLPGSRCRTAREDDAFRLSDLGRYGRQVVRRFVAEARSADRPSFREMLVQHLGSSVHTRPVTLEQWPPYEHVNVHGALNDALAEHGDRAQVIGVSGHRHRGPFGIADLLTREPGYLLNGPRPDNVTRIALLLRGPDEDSGSSEVTLEIVADRPGAAERLGQRLRRLTLEHNVYRGQVVSFGHGMFGERGSLLRFRERPRITREELILPAATFDDLRRQVVGVARHSTRLRAAGQHLTRGLLLYGPPGARRTPCAT